MSLFLQLIRPQSCSGASGFPNLPKLTPYPDLTASVPVSLIPNPPMYIHSASLPASKNPSAIEEEGDSEQT